MFAAGSIMASMQGDIVPPGGGGNPSVPRNGIGGSAVGLRVATGRLLTRHAGIGIEISVPRQFHADQRAAKYRTRNAHHDLIVSGVVYAQPANGRWQAVGGLDWVRENTRQEISHADPLGGGYGPFAPFKTVIRDTLGITGGVDLSFRLSSAVAMSPGVRIHWIMRDSESLDFLGLSPVVFRPHFGIAIAF
jgi:hypothetical protein